MGATTFGVIIGNRGFFPGILARDGREEVLRALAERGYKTICLTPEDTKFGAVETLEDARKCADLFKRHREEIDGILVSLPNFGDERGVANSIRMSGLDVPVLVHAYPDAADKMRMGARRDSFCGKISVCNNLWQYGIRYTLTESHTVAPTSDSFRSDLNSFAATCRIVKGLRNVRVGYEVDKPELRVSIERSRAASLGVSIQDISRTMQIFRCRSSLIFQSIDMPNRGIQARAAEWLLSNRKIPPFDRTGVAPS